MGNKKKIAELAYNNEEKIEKELQREDVELIAGTDTHTNTNNNFRESSTDTNIENVQNDTVKPKSIIKIRDNVKKKQEKAAESMENKQNHKRNKRTLEFDLGDAVTVLIPRIDRGGSDLPRAPGIVNEIKLDLYRVVTKFSILNNCLRASELELYNGVLDFDYK